MEKNSSGRQDGGQVLKNELVYLSVLQYIEWVKITFEYTSIS
ncbi:hypothetical protein KP78_00810 [Jeotgalibacillus soli]|uniref:Uncharacterized protein n=1 Tax=Jeotgalibacillus soli TaxID=889306 RepID=A0A0C2W8D8_9BACL|nr:hypothetical protein KP78_00810 [Jeotgalibacillus soli]